MFNRTCIKNDDRLTMYIKNKFGKSKNVCIYLAFIDINLQYIESYALHCFHLWFGICVDYSILDFHYLIETINHGLEWKHVHQIQDTRGIGKCSANKVMHSNETL